MADSNVEIALMANVARFLKPMNQASKKVEQFERITARAQERLKKASIGFTAAFAGQLFMMKKATDAAATQELAEKKLADALAATGDNTTENTERLKQYAAALQGVTTFGDEAIIESMAFLKTLGVSTDMLETATQATLDLAAATGMNLESAARNVGKTMGGFAGELGEVIPELKALSAEQLKAGQGIDLIAAKFEGRAAGAADTFDSTSMSGSLIVSSMMPDMPATLFSGAVSSLPICPSSTRPITTTLSSRGMARKRRIATTASPTSSAIFCASSFVTDIASPVG